MMTLNTYLALFALALFAVLNVSVTLLGWPGAAFVVLGVLDWIDNRASRQLNNRF